MTPVLSEEQMMDTVTKFKKILTDNGSEIVFENNWGLRKLAYPIQKKTEGYYVLFEIEGSGQEIAELERRMRVNDMIIRYITVRVDEERDAAARKREKRERRAEKRASFRSAPEAASAPSEARVDN